MLALSVWFASSCQVVDESPPIAFQQKVPLQENVVFPLHDVGMEDIVEDSVLLRRTMHFDSSRVPYPLLVLSEIPEIRVEEVQVPSGHNPLHWVAELRHTGQFEFVEPKVITQPRQRVGPTVVPQTQVRVAQGDPYAYLQWHMDLIEVDQLGEDAQGFDIRVAVLDGGFSALMTDPPINLLEGYDFSNDDPDTDDSRGHGTHVTNTIAEATGNGIGARGVAPQSEILPVKVTNASGTSTSQMRAEGIVYAVDRGAQVINISVNTTQQTAVEASALDYALDNGVAIVSSAGNDYETNPVHQVYFPASYEGVIAVGAVNPEMQIAGYSNRGSEIDLAAPGGEMYDLAGGVIDLNEDGYPDGVFQEGVDSNGAAWVLQEGTSMAAPHVSGGIAALMSAGFSAEEAVEALMETAVDMGPFGWDPAYGYGVIQLRAAYEYLMPPLEVNALEARYRPNREELTIRHYNQSAVFSILCGYSDELNDEVCTEAPQTSLPYQDLQLLGVNPEEFELYLFDAAGNEYFFWFEFEPEEVNQWQVVEECDTEAPLFNLQVSESQQRIQLRYTTSRPMEVQLCGDLVGGGERCSERWTQGNGHVNLMGPVEEYWVRVRDIHGCTRYIEELPDFVGAFPERTRQRPL